MAKSTSDSIPLTPAPGSGQDKRGNLWIWPFELTQKIGEGGMASVYRGRFVKNDRFFAVKLLPSETTSNETMLARFQREMELLKGLRHDNIVRCFGGTCENGQPFYAMELIEGGTLDDLLRKVGRRTWRTTAECGLQMCAALEYAHSKGIVHRDVKPSNFLIDGDTLKLSDFGLALITSGAKLTAAEKTVGTFDYMAPEQISGREVTPRTDFYALGCVFYEMLAGRPPFVAEERVAILHKHLREKPAPISSLVHQCPPAFERLIDDLLEKDPAHRPTDAAEIAERLHAILDERDVQLPTKAHRTTRTVESSQAAIGEPSVSSAKRSAPASSASRTRLRSLVAVLAVACVALTVWGYTLQDRVDPNDAALERWVTTAETSDERPVRLAAVRALGELSAKSDVAYDSLVELAKDEDEDPVVRAEAIEGFAKAGSRGREQLAFLRKLYKKEEQAIVRDAAGRAEGHLKRVTSPPGSPWWSRAALLALLLVVVAVIGWWPDRGPAQGSSRAAGER